MSGRVFAPRSRKVSLKRRFSPLFRASLIVIGVSADGAALVDAMFMGLLGTKKADGKVMTDKAGVSGVAHKETQGMYLS